jgi:hypothetical protein
MTDLAINATGEAWGITFTSLYRVDLATARCTFVAPFAGAQFNGLSFIPGGELEPGEVLVAANRNGAYVTGSILPPGPSVSSGSTAPTLGSSGDIVSVAERRHLRHHRRPRRRLRRGARGVPRSHRSHQRPRDPHRPHRGHPHLGRRLLALAGLRLHRGTAPWSRSTSPPAAPPRWPALGNQYDDDRVLRSYLARTMPAEALKDREPALARARRARGDELYALQLADRLNEPVLTPWDPWGNRIDHIELTACGSAPRRSPRSTASSRRGTSARTGSSRASTSSRGCISSPVDGRVHLPPRDDRRGRAHAPRARQRGAHRARAAAADSAATRARCGRAASG